MHSRYRGYYQTMSRNGASLLTWYLTDMEVNTGVHMPHSTCQVRCRVGCMYICGMYPRILHVHVGFKMQCACPNQRQCQTQEAASQKNLPVKTHHDQRTSQHRCWLVPMLALVFVMVHCTTCTVCPYKQSFVSKSYNDMYIWILSE